jgi:hypothetical protein
MTPLNIIAGMIDRDKKKAEETVRLKENYNRFRGSVEVKECQAESLKNQSQHHRQ